MFVKIIWRKQYFIEIEVCRRGNVYSKKINSHINDRITSRELNDFPELKCRYQIFAIGFSDFFRFFSVEMFRGEKKTIEAPKENHRSRQKIFILSGVCIEMVFEARFIEGVGAG